MNKMIRLMPKQCPQCQCGLYEVLLGDDGEPAKLECNMCSAAFPVNVPRVLTINDSILLGQINTGVERGLKLRWYQFGTRDADHPMIVMMRAFTYEGGNLYPHDKDVRDAYVWCSGFTERWIKVSDLITALDNMQGKHGLDNPMAVIESDDVTGEL